MQAHSASPLSTQLAAEIDHHLQQSKLIGMGAVVIQNGEISALAVQGLRHKGHQAAIATTPK